MIPYGEHKRKATPTWRSEPVGKVQGRKRARAMGKQECLEEKDRDMIDLAKKYNKPVRVVRYENDTSNSNNLPRTNGL